MTVRRTYPLAVVLFLVALLIELTVISRTNGVETTMREKRGDKAGSLQVCLELLC